MTSRAPFFFLFFLLFFDNKSLFCLLPGQGSPRRCSALTLGLTHVRRGRIALIRIEFRMFTLAHSFGLPVLLTGKYSTHKRVFERAFILGTCLHLGRSVYLADCFSYVQRKNCFTRWIMSPTARPTSANNSDFIIFKFRKKKRYSYLWSRVI